MGDSAPEETPVAALEAPTCPPLLLPPPPSAAEAPAGGFLSKLRRPALRLTSEYDSDRATFFHKVSCKLLDGFAKLRLTFQNDSAGAVSAPQIGLLTSNVSLLYDLESRNALLKGSFDASPRLRFRASRDIKVLENDLIRGCTIGLQVGIFLHHIQEDRGEVAMIGALRDSSYKLEISSSLPIPSLPKATINFPLGEVQLEKRDLEATDALSVNAVLRSDVMNGILTVNSGTDQTRFRYSYKDDEMTFIPSVSLPSNFSFAFKRRFSSSDKLSYWYHFSSNEWSTVYKRIVGKDLKLKAGYDSEIRLAWASLWVGNENTRTTMAPMKAKMQLMLQVPQDDIANSVFLFRVKKRWDF